MKTEKLKIINTVAGILVKLLGAFFITGIAVFLPLFPFGMFNRDYFILIKNTYNVFYLLNIELVLLIITFFQFRSLVFLINRIFSCPLSNISIKEITTFVVLHAILLFNSLSLSASLAIKSNLCNENTTSIIIPLYLFNAAIVYIFEIVLLCYKRNKLEAK